MNTYSVVVRLRRTVSESVHVPVLVTDDLTKEPEADGTRRLDTTLLFAEAVRTGQEDVLDWCAEPDASVEIHPLQTPPDETTTPAIGALARRWIGCFERHDLDALISLYAEDAVHTSPKLRVLHPETAGVLRGREALRAWWAEAFERLPELRYELTHLTVGHSQVFMEYERQVPGEAVMQVAEVLVVERGQIVASRVYHG